MNKMQWIWWWGAWEIPYLRHWPKEWSLAALLWFSVGVGPLEVRVWHSLGVQDRLIQEKTA